MGNGGFDEACSRPHQFEKGSDEVRVGYRSREAVFEEETEAEHASAHARRNDNSSFECRHRVGARVQKKRWFAILLPRV